MKILNQGERSRLRGAATVESLLGLFSFVLIWAAVLHMSNLYQKQLAANAKVRGCAWTMSANACAESPPGCPGSIGGGVGTTKNLPWDKQGANSNATGTLGQMVQAPLKNQLSHLFGERTKLTSREKVTKPPLLGGKTVAVSAQYSLPCNTKKTSLGDVSERMMGEILREDE